MLNRLCKKSTALLFLALGACGLTSRCSMPEPIDQASFEALYAAPAQIPDKPLRLFHLGHSLVGRDMPVMVQQLAGAGHQFNSQLGWGTRLNAHWEPDVPIKGFETENQHPQFRAAHAAAASGDYDAFVLTEGVEIRHSIQYGNSAEYLYKWADAIWAANPETRVYLYESWHKLTDDEGWLTRLDRDLGLYWEGEILRRALAYPDQPRPIYIIPAGQVMAAFVRRVESLGGIGPIRDRTDLFKRKDDGSQDPIHFNDFGAYLVALTHYATLYGKDPAGLPYRLDKNTGEQMQPLGPEAAALMQQVVWEVVTAYRPSGVRP